MARTQWVITRDYICSGEATGTSSRSFKGDKSALPHKFRMRDDDGIVYYHGLSNNDSSFLPLDDFGMPNAGATILEYKNPETGAWEIL